jgi:hypothetical protein
MKICMKKLVLILAVIGGTCLVAVLATRSRVNTSSDGSPSVPVAGDHLVQDFSQAGTPANNHNIEESRSATEAHRKIESRELETKELVEAIQDALRSGDAGRWEQVSQNQLVQLIRDNPFAAAGLAQTLEPGPIREQMLRQVAQGWAAQDSTAALEWAAGLADAGEHDSALANVCIQMSQSSPAEAVSAAGQYGLKDEGGLFENMVQQWAGKDEPAALDWVSRQPAGSERDEMMARLAFVEAQISPENAVDLVLREIPPGPAQVEAAISVLHQWGLRDFAGASAWVDQFPAGPLADRARQELAGIASYQLALNH